MKKHPVDKLFAHKLAQWEPEPSAGLWERIEAKQMKSPPTWGGWYWYAAAGVAIMLVTGYVVWQSQTSKIINDNPKMAHSEQKGTHTKTVPTDTIPPVELRQIAEAKTSGMANQSGPITAPDEKKGVIGKPKTSDSPEPKELRPVLSAIEIAKLDKQGLDLDPIVENNKELEINSLVATPSPGTDPTIEEPTKSRVIIAHIQPDEPEQDDPKSSKLFRILRQLKNAKQGEAVDWEEVGFNPKKLMARADERLRNEEEKLSKQYQNLKDKTKL